MKNINKKNPIFKNYIAKIAIKLIKINNYNRNNNKNNNKNN